MLKKDRERLRQLAGQYAEIANGDENQKKLDLHRGVNDLCMERPIVLLDEIPWNSLSGLPEMRLTCEDTDARAMEWQFCAMLCRARHFSADWYYAPYYGVQKVIRNTGIGLDIKEETLGGEQGGISAHAYIDQLQTEEDLERMQMPKIVYDEAAAEKAYAFAADILDGVLPVQVTGAATGYELGYRIWDIVAMLKGKGIRA